MRDEYETMKKPYERPDDGSVDRVEMMLVESRARA
jgi:hypothetical protein